MIRSCKAWGRHTERICAIVRLFAARRGNPKTPVISRDSATSILMDIAEGLRTELSNLVSFNEEKKVWWDVDVHLK